MCIGSLATTGDEASARLYTVSGRCATPTVQRSYCGCAAPEGAGDGDGTGASAWLAPEPSARARTAAYPPSTAVSTTASPTDQDHDVSSALAHGNQG